MRELAIEEVDDLRDGLAGRVDRSNALLEQQLAAVTQERDSLRSRLTAARGRIDTLLERLPAEADADDTRRSAP